MRGGDEVVLNYDSKPNCDYLFQFTACAMKLWASTCLNGVVAGQVVKEGEEVLLNYDSKPNCDRLFLYGFLDIQNM